MPKTLDEVAVLRETATMDLDDDGRYIAVLAVPWGRTTVNGAVEDWKPGGARLRTSPPAVLRYEHTKRERVPVGYAVSSYDSTEGFVIVFRMLHDPKTGQLTAGASEVLAMAAAGLEKGVSIEFTAANSGSNVRRGVGTMQPGRQGTINGVAIVESTPLIPGARVLLVRSADAPPRRQPSRAERIAAHVAVGDFGGLRR